MKRTQVLLVACLLALTAGTIQAQEEVKKDSVWTISGFVGLKFTQVSFSNWASGGNNAVAFDAQGNYQANYKKGKHLWNNRIELAYGLNNNKADGTRKTNDKIYLNTNYGYQVHDKLYLSGLVNFQTQFTTGYNYANNPDEYISTFMAPAYLIVGTGIGWTPDKHITVTASPVSYRATIVMDSFLSDQGAYGVDPGKNIFSEFGANLKIEAKYDIMKNMNIYSRLDLYSAYTNNPQNVDVNWDVQLNMIINKWFSTSISTNLIYDDDIKITQEDGRKGPRVQFKELFGVGLQFNF